MKFFLFLSVAFISYAAMASQQIDCSTKVNPKFQTFSKLRLVADNSGILTSAKMVLIGTDGHVQEVQISHLKHPEGHTYSPRSTQEILYTFQGYSLFIPLDRGNTFPALMTISREDGGSASWSFTCSSR